MCNVYRRIQLYTLYIYVRYFEFFLGGRGMCGCKYLTFKIFIEASEFETREKVAASER